jgi:hypothetical protein
VPGHVYVADLSLTHLSKNDLIASGTYTGAADGTYTVTIDLDETPNTFKWKKNAESDEFVEVAITGSVQSLILDTPTVDEGVRIQFLNTTGHVVNDSWTINTKAVQAVNEISKHYTTWEKAAGIPWSSSVSQAGYLIDIGAGTDGLTYALHEAENSSVSSIFILGAELTNGEAPDNFKRLHWVRMFYRGEAGGSIQHYIKGDTEAAWHLLDAHDTMLVNGVTTAITAVNLLDTKDIFDYFIPCDFRAKHFLIKGVATNRFRLVGMIFGFTLLGDR